MCSLLVSSPCVQDMVHSHSAFIAHKATRHMVARFLHYQTRGRICLVLAVPDVLVTHSVGYIRRICFRNRVFAQLRADYTEYNQYRMYQLTYRISSSILQQWSTKICAVSHKKAYRWHRVVPLLKAWMCMSGACHTGNIHYTFDGIYLDISDIHAFLSVCSRSTKSINLLMGVGTSYISACPSLILSTESGVFTLG